MAICALNARPRATNVSLAIAGDGRTNGSRSWLSGMSGCTGADKVLPPVRRRAILIMRLHRLTVVPVVIAENSAALVQAATVADEHFQK